MNLSVLSGDTEYIARISHGKDSRKMLDVIVSRGLPLDRITTTDIWATDTIRGGTSQNGGVWVQDGRKHLEGISHRSGAPVRHAKRRESHIREDVLSRPQTQDQKCGGGLQTARNDPRLPNPVGAVVPVRSQSTRDCRRASLYKEGHGAKSSSIYGFPVSINRKGQWCQKLKTRFLDGPATGGGKNIVEYLGIAADEPKRFGQLNDRKRAPLVEFGIEEGLCGLYCQYKGILAPTYETGCRDGCWMCHNQGVNQLRQLRHDYPHLWALLLKWDTDSPVNFHPDGHTVHDFDLRFRLEDEGLLKPGDTRFKWKQLHEDLQYSLF